MSKFLNNLAKGFVRSAVNQVGRDGGRVISNKIYGDRHSIPIRNTQNSGKGKIKEMNAISENSSEIKIENYPYSRELLYEEGFTPELFETNLISKFLMLVGAIFLSYIWPISVLIPIYFIFIAFKNLLKRSTPFYIFKSNQVYKDDKRFRSGKRPDGQSLEKVYADIEIIPSPKEKLIFTLKGLIALGLAIVFSYIQYLVHFN